MLERKVRKPLLSWRLRVLGMQAESADKKVCSTLGWFMVPANSPARSHLAQCGSNSQPLCMVHSSLPMHGEQGCLSAGSTRAC